MGLLTNPNTGQGFMSKLLIAHHGKLSCLLYLTGLVWFLCLAHKSFNAATYFSENALLPGLVRGEFEEDRLAVDLYRELEEETAQHPDSIPYSWILDKFRQMNLDAYLHNFTLDYPLKPNTSFTGQNVYAVMRASRSASWEGLVVSAPFRTKTSVEPSNNAAIAMMMALAKFCRRQKYWAKDIVFLITDHEQLGTQAWLDAYHEVDSGSGILHHGTLPARAGALQAAINLEFHSNIIYHVDLKIEGLNGQLPNLDFVNLVHKLCSKEGVRHTFKNRTNARKHVTSYDQWKHSLNTLLSMVLSQATGVPDGNHGLFHRFGIQAVTMEGHAPKPGIKATYAGFYKAGRILEGILRSLNNLLEKFHQSYFFYLLPGVDRYISIGFYMPAVGLAGVTFLIKALCLWLKLYKKLTRCESETEEETTGTTTTNREEDKFNLAAVCLVVFLTHNVGLCYVKMSPYLTLYGDQYNIDSSVSVYTGYLVLSVVSVFCFNFVRVSVVDNMVIHMLALLELTTLLLTISMINFSLGFLITLILVPVVLPLSPNNSRLKSLFTKTTFLLTHSFVLLHLSVFLYTVYHFPDETFEKMIKKSFTATSQALVYFNVDNMIYSNWTNDILFGWLTANWLLFWTISQRNVNYSS